MSLSVRSGEGLWQRAEVPLSATFGPKLRCMAPPQRIPTRPPETRGADGTSTKATIGSCRYRVTRRVGASLSSVVDEVRRLEQAGPTVITTDRWARRGTGQDRFVDEIASQPLVPVPLTNQGDGGPHLLRCAGSGVRQSAFPGGVKLLFGP